MRPCLKRQPSKAQGFTAAAVLEEIHRAGSNLSSHTSHIIRRVQQQAAWRFSIKSPGVRVSFGRLPDCRSDHQSAPKRKKHSFFRNFFPKKGRKAETFSRNIKRLVLIWEDADDCFGIHRGGYGSLSERGKTLPPGTGLPAHRGGKRSALRSGRHGRAVGDFYPAGRNTVHLRRNGAALPARDGRLAAGRKRRHAQAFPAGKRAGVGTTDVERPEPGHARRRDRPSAGGAAPVRGRSDRSGPVGRAGAAVRRQKYRRPAGLLRQRNGADPVPQVYLPARQYALFPGGRALSDGADELYSSEK